MELAERVFEIDSEAVVEILRDLRGDAGLEARWRLTLVGMDRLLEDAGLDVPRKLQLVREARNALQREFGGRKRLERSMAERFRRERAVLTALLEGSLNGESPLWSRLQVLQLRSERLGPVMDAFLTCEREGRLITPAPGILWSYLHMFANRLLRSAARQQELVLYDFLTQLYASKVAREKRVTSSAAK